MGRQVPLWRRGRWIRRTAGCAVAACAASCAAPPPPPPITVAVLARAGNGTPTPNVEIFSGPLLVARTGDDGRARLDVAGAEGETFELRVKCPAGFHSPGAPLAVRRLGIVATTTIPEYLVTCREARHALVVVVRAEGGANLPLLYLGKTIARTDASGAAHVLFEMDVRERVELTLSTAGKDNEKLHPQNPATTFEMGERDAIAMFPVTFTRDKPKPPPAHGPRQGPKVF